MPNTFEADTQTEEFGVSDRLGDVKFERVCIEILTRFNINMDEVVKTLKEVYSNVIDRKKRKGQKVLMTEIKCELVFRKLESPRSEDVLLVFGPHQLVILDVVPFVRVNPVNGKRTKTAVLRICPGSFGKFSDKYPNEIGANRNKVVSRVRHIVDKEQSDSSVDADGTNCY